MVFTHNFVCVQTQHSPYLQSFGSLYTCTTASTPVQLRPLHASPFLLTLRVQRDHVSVPPKGTNVRNTVVVDAQMYTHLYTFIIREPTLRHKEDGSEGIMPSCPEKEASIGETVKLLTLLLALQRSLRLSESPALFYIRD